MKKNLLHLFLCMAVALAAISLQAQEYSNLRSRTFPVISDTIKLDSLSILFRSVSVSDAFSDSPISPSLYTVDHINALLIWTQRAQVDSVRIDYRVFPFLFSENYFKKDTAWIVDKPTIIVNPFIYTPDAAQEGVLDFGGLDYNGSFARGISFGNNQDVVLNSSFNLQLSGNLGEEVEIKAAMTDNNVPIQPEGNTQQIQDFDQVYIELTRRRSTLTVGDIELVRPESYFMNFYKKLQGAKFRTAADVFNDKAVMGAGGSVAVSKGQYARNTIDGQEGNQGPYRLRGNNGETFLIVLAGTERVYIDGVLLLRGAENDYVIDYNAGELTFTPNRLITKDSRIVVEFEYSAENYFRSLFFAENSWSTKKMNFRINVYSEQDSKNQPILDSLDNEKKKLLSSIGDDLDAALYPGYFPSEFQPNINQYKLIDTLVNGILYDSIFVFSTNPDSARYRVNFSFVGEGKGYYRISQGLINGRVYEWVAPVNGVLQGSYLPVIQLVTPKQQQMFTLGADYKFSETNILTSEVAISNYDVNTFSPIDDADDDGVAARVGWINTVKIRDIQKNKISLATKANYEFAAEQFIPIETYRNIEFSRDWNLSPAPERVDEHLGNLELEFITSNYGIAGYGISSFIREGEYQGLRQRLISGLRWKGFNLIINSSLLNSASDQENTTFLRPAADFSKTFYKLKSWKLGVAGEMEQNEIQPVNVDSMSIRSFLFHTYKVYIVNSDTAVNRFGADFSSRTDYLPVGNNFISTTLGNTANFFGALQKNPNSQLRWKTTYRELNILNPSLTPQQEDVSVLGRVEYSFALWKGFVRSSTLYEVGSGQEQRREFAYLEVPAGQGVYVWNDDGDGLQELDEFELASQNDQIFANFIKVITPTNEYIRANITQFNEVLNLDPRSVWTNSKGVKKFISRFSNVSIVQLNRKLLSAEGLESLDPFELNISDDALISVNSLLRNTFYYNRTSADFGIEINWQDIRNKHLLTNGPESRQHTEQGGRIRWSLTSEILTEIMYKNGEKSSFSDAFANRNYSYDYHEAEPVLTYQKGTIYRISLGYKYAIKDNRPEFGEQLAIIHQGNAEFRYNIVSKSILNFRLSFANIDFSNGDASSSLAYSMLEGLQPGRNYLWNIGYERKLANNVQIGINYDGRKAGDNAIIHVGRAQVRAVF